MRPRDPSNRAVPAGRASQAQGVGSPVHMVIRKTYLNKQANNFSLKDLKVLKP